MYELVKDLMVPISKFPKIKETATFAAAVLALEQAQLDYLAGRKEQRIVLVQDENGKIVGKLSPNDVIRGLEPLYETLDLQKVGSQVDTLELNAIQAMQKQTLLWNKPLDILCSAAKDVKVKDFARRPNQTQVIGSEENLNAALHRFVLFRHDSLFVREDKKLVGLLRFSDVYKEIGRRVKDVCQI